MVGTPYPTLKRTLSGLGGYSGTGSKFDLFHTNFVKKMRISLCVGGWMVWLMEGDTHFTTFIKPNTTK